jgi:hypothetical protein
MNFVTGAQHRWRNDAWRTHSSRHERAVEISPKLLEECRILSDAFVEEVSGGPAEATGTREFG